uniref:Immunoglobulin V-set domain-containing protein n=1 Tax=Callorhinchus milii TaxID=7868 RepID=A0A4W3H3S9_CALMI
SAFFTDITTKAEGQHCGCLLSALCWEPLCQVRLWRANSVFLKHATVVKKEGETVTVEFTYPTTGGPYYLFWYRHYPYKQPEFIRRYFSGSDSPFKGKGFENRFNAQLQNSKSMTSLSISVLVASDSAVYFCAFSLTTVKDCTASVVQKLPSLCTKGTSASLSPAVSRKTSVNRLAGYLSCRPLLFVHLPPPPRDSAPGSVTVKRSETPSGLKGAIQTQIVVDIVVV